ncbi:thiamine pyrophosphate-dependent enzyme [Thermoproteota archaeon]
MKPKTLLSGNEAIALGAYEAGCRIGTGYPGTPSTEILEHFITFRDAYAEWSVNEKTAVETAIGVSLGGKRALAVMKHVGVNVAADPIFTASYIGVNGGLVIVTADDPGMHSSQNEQDNRNYALAAKIPMLEPSDSQEARDYTKLAFDLSEKYDTPVFIRSVTRLSHSKTLVSTPDTKNTADTPSRTAYKSTRFKRDIKKYVMIPGNARPRRVELEKRLLKLFKACNTLPINTMETPNKKLGFITSGVTYQYVKESFPHASILKLGMVYPLPFKLIKEFCSQIQTVFIVEELDPYLETQIRAQGITNIHGKDTFPSIGEFNPQIIKQSLASAQCLNAVHSPTKALETSHSPLPIPNRPPELCKGCPHRSIFQILKDLNITVSGDIGCYSLGALPPFESMHTLVDMGASITVAQGLELAGKPSVAVIGDSTFAHSGITGLLNAAYNKRNTLIIILDNHTTAMTGMQPNPLTGETLMGEPAFELDYIKLGEAVGIKKSNIKIVNAFKKEAVQKALVDLLDSKKLSLLILQGPCLIYHKKKMKMAS